MVVVVSVSIQIAATHFILLRPAVLLLCRNTTVLTRDTRTREIELHKSTMFISIERRLYLVYDEVTVL